MSQKEFYLEQASRYAVAAQGAELLRRRGDLLAAERAWRKLASFAVEPSLVSNNCASKS